MANNEIPNTNFWPQFITGTGGAPVPGTIIVEDGGIPVTGNPVTAINFTNGATPITISGGVATVNIAGMMGSGITMLTGDGTATGPGSAVLTLATVNANIGTFGSASVVASPTVNGKGLVTAITGIMIQIAETQVTNLVADLAGKLSTTLPSGDIFVGNGSNIATGVAVSGDATLSNAGALTFNTVNSNVGTFGDSTHVFQGTVNAKGQVTAATSVAIAFPGGFTGFANPTAVVGITAVNGVATTAMRSDAAPAISTSLFANATTLATGIVTSSLTAVGTLTTGVWNATTIAVANGGTGLGTLTANNVILGAGTSVPTFVAPGTSGNVLTSNGTTWTSAVLSVPQSALGAVPILTKTSNYTILTTDFQSRTLFLVDTTSAAFTLTLPNPATLSGYLITIKDSTGQLGTNALTLARNGSEKIENTAASKVFYTPFGGWNIFCDGTNWWVV